MQKCVGTLRGAVGQGIRVPPLTSLRTSDAHPWQGPQITLVSKCCILPEVCGLIRMIEESLRNPSQRPAMIGLDSRSRHACALSVNLSSRIIIIDSQRHDRSSPATRLRRRVSKINNVGCAREDRPNHLALHADSPAVNDAHPKHAPAVRLLEVVFNHCANLTRRNRVQIDHVLEFDDDYIGEGIVRVELPAFIFGGLDRRAPRTFRLKLAAKPAEQQIEEHTPMICAFPASLKVSRRLSRQRQADARTLNFEE